MYKLGDREQLSKKYGNINTNLGSSIPQRMKKTAINQNASFNKMTKITLPLEPSTLIKITEKPTVTVVKDHNIKGSTKLDLLNFIDITKLKENRSGFKIKSYALEDLKHLARLLEIFKNERPKAYFLEKIREEINKVFNNDNNLISDLRELHNDEAKQIKNIVKLFDKHDISEPTKTELLNKIKDTIKEYRTTDDMVNIIIEVIERQWIDHSEKPTKSKGSPKVTSSPKYTAKSKK